MKILQTGIKIAMASLTPCSYGPGHVCLLSFEAQSLSPDPELRKKEGKPRRWPGSGRGRSETPDSAKECLKQSLQDDLTLLFSSFWQTGTLRPREQ